MRIAIVGSGISGLTSAYYLQKSGHDVHVFEANDYIGGHTHTVSVNTSSGQYAIDTGFIVFNKKTYPNFVKLLQQLNVASQATDMSFSVYVPKINLQYAGGSLNSLFADRFNVLKPKFYGLLFEIRRFQRLAAVVINKNDQHSTLDDFLHTHKFTASLRDFYLYPLISALWSTPPQQIAQMPIYFVAKFFHNHALLKMVPDLPWQVIAGGSANYVAALIKDFTKKIQLRTAITKIVRTITGCYLFSSEGELGCFDKVVIATHSDQALSLLAEPTFLELEILSKFTYQPNEVILHTDTQLLPPNKRAWSSWNYWVSSRQQGNAVLTYDMNRLQSLSAPEQFCVSLNASHLIQPETIIRRFNYSHPQYTPDSLAAQSRQVELNSNNQIYYCGAYWGFGFHEDGVNSALQVCEQIEKS